MPVEFGIRKFRGCIVASLTTVGPWPGDDKLKDQFYRVAEWAKAKGVRTGRWFFLEYETKDEKKMRLETCIEVKSRVRSGKGVKVKTFPEGHVATITFDPRKIRPMVIYLAMEGYLEWRKKAKEYKQSGHGREVYRGDPWSNNKAWSSVEIQVPVKKLS